MIETEGTIILCYPSVLIEQRGELKFNWAFAWEDLKSERGKRRDASTFRPKPEAPNQTNRACRGCGLDDTKNSSGPVHMGERPRDRARIKHLWSSNF
jgi:hypothetical protein